MAKKAYIGVGGVARKVKKVYCAVDGIARKVKKGYIGVGGVARPIGVGESAIAYFGAAPNMVDNRYYHAEATIANFALFAGGYKGSPNEGATTVDAYNNNLARVSAPALTEGKYQFDGAANDAYAIFSGGFRTDGGLSSTTDAYNSNLIKSSAPSGTSRYNIAAARTTNHAVFAGGVDANSNISNAVDAYDSVLTRTGLSLTYLHYAMARASIAGNAIFSGGGRGAGSTSGSTWCGSETIAVNSVLTISYLASLSLGRDYLAAAANKAYVAIAGGQDDNNSIKSTVDIYTASLVKGTNLSLGASRYGLAGVSVDDFVLFGGGAGYKSKRDYNSNEVDVFNDQGVRVSVLTMGKARVYPQAASVGSYALFAGGTGDGVGEQNSVDAFVSL